MMPPWLLTLIGAAALISFGLGFVTYPLLLRWGIIDQPGVRSSHTSPTARGGGVGIMLVVAAGVSMGAWSLPLQAVHWAALGAALVVAGLSFWDDVSGLSAGLRFLSHVAAALAVLLVLVLDAPGLPAGWVWLLLPLFFLWMTGYTNVFNFMDGINGLAAAQAVVTSSGMLLFACSSGEPTASAVIPAAMAGAALGFLPHNFPRARMFMGDVGSAPLGFLLAFSTISLGRDLSWDSVIPLVLLQANFFLDSGITLVRRVLWGEKWYEAHREHFYQRLVRSGKSHSFVTLAESALQIVALIILFLCWRSGVLLHMLLVPVLWLCFFAYCEVQFRRSQAARGATKSLPVCPDTSPTSTTPARAIRP